MHSLLLCEILGIFQFLKTIAVAKGNFYSRGNATIFNLLRYRSVEKDFPDLKKNQIVFVVTGNLKLDTRIV